MKKFSERIGKRFESRLNDVMENFKDEHVIRVFGRANFFGQESLGVGQVRGNGVLVLTDTELYFELWYPTKIVRIPITSIQRIDTPISHLTKTRFKELLKVFFTNEKHQDDSAAWLITHLREWKDALEQLIHK